MKVRVHKTVAMLLLAGVTGCASGPFHHRKTPPPPALQPPPPELSQTPLYSPEMSDGAAKVPTLPATQTPAVLKSPPPQPEKPQKKRKPRPPATTVPKNTATVSGGPTAATPATGSTAAPAAAAAVETASSPTPVEKKASETQQAASSEAPAASPIGELTAGDSAEAARTSRQAEDLIRNTRSGVDGIKRELTPDEKKTVEQIRTFLKRAEQALQNSDVDGAYGLATKAKLLLDELTTK